MNASKTFAKTFGFTTPPGRLTHTARACGRTCGVSVKHLWSGVKGRHVLIYKKSEDTNSPTRPKVHVTPYPKMNGGNLT